MKWRFIYRGLRARFRDQNLEITALINHLKEDDVAIDVGANKGSYLWALSKAVPRGKVIAFEPQQKLCDYLRKDKDKLIDDYNFVYERVYVEQN